MQTRMSDPHRRLSPIRPRRTFCLSITDLAGAGATTFLVPNLPDIGLTPSSSGDPALAAYRSDLTAAYNSALAMVLGDAEASLGVNIIAFDVAATVCTAGHRPVDVWTDQRNGQVLDG